MDRFIESAEKERAEAEAFLMALCVLLHYDYIA